MKTNVMRLAAGCLLLPCAASAGEMELGPVTAEYTLTGNYAAAWRLESANAAVVDAPGDPRLPVSEELKFPQSNNFDDGDRNFAKHDLVNNRLSLIGDIEFNWQISACWSAPTRSMTRPITAPTPTRRPTG